MCNVRLLSCHKEYAVVLPGDSAAGYSIPYIGNCDDSVFPELLRYIFVQNLRPHKVLQGAVDVFRHAILVQRVWCSELHMDPVGLQMRAVFARDVLSTTIRLKCSNFCDQSWIPQGAETS